MEVCPKTELIAIEDPATVCDSAFQIGEGREAQMIRHMRHGSSPGLMAPQPILGSNRRESLAIPSAGDRITTPPVEAGGFSGQLRGNPPTYLPNAVSRRKSE